jgi:autophagy-related protein 13
VRGRRINGCVPFLPSSHMTDGQFNIVIPDVDIHKADLQVYKSISTFSTTSDDTSAVPPLLVAFILDTSDIPSNQALLWSRGSSRETLDTGRIAKGKGKETRSGIVLERWTFQARQVFFHFGCCNVLMISAASDTPSGSQIAAHTAYRMGIIHFRALYSLLRTLPAYRLHRKLRRSTNGLRLGLKLWAPEGYPNTEKGLQEAWDVMEQGLVGIDTGLDTLVDSLDIEPDQDTRRYDLPSLDLFGNEYRLSVNYRPEIDIHVEDLESVLSEKFVDMEEDWFTPTVARHRMGEGSIPSSVASASSNPPSRRVGTPTTMPSSNPAPIPQRQGPASIGSFQSGMVPGSRSRQASAQRAEPVVSERWGSIGEGLPFATGTTNQDIKVCIRLKACRARC